LPDTLFDKASLATQNPTGKNKLSDFTHRVETEYQRSLARDAKTDVKCGCFLANASMSSDLIMLVPTVIRYSFNQSK
jgi:hypothetical protein